MDRSDISRLEGKAPRIAAEYAFRRQVIEASTPDPWEAAAFATGNDFTSTSPPVAPLDVLPHVAQDPAVQSGNEDDIVPRDPMDLDDVPRSDATLSPYEGNGKGRVIEAGEPSDKGGTIVLSDDEDNIVVAPRRAPPPAMAIRPAPSTPAAPGPVAGPKMSWTPPMKYMVHRIFNSKLNKTDAELLFNTIFEDEIEDQGLTGSFPWGRLDAQNREKGRKDREPHADWVEIMSNGGGEVGRANREMLDATFSIVAQELGLDP